MVLGRSEHLHRRFVDELEAPLGVLDDDPIGEALNYPAVESLTGGGLFRLLCEFVPQAFGFPPLLLGNQPRLSQPSCHATDEKRNQEKSDESENVRRSCSE